MRNMYDYAYEYEYQYFLGVTGAIRKGQEKCLP